MDTHRTAQFIASLILANCEAHLNGRKSRAAWSKEQNRLWNLAAHKLVASDVIRMVYPTPPPPPPYAVRKRLADATRQAGR